jgi:hypothetical protein
MEGAHTFFAQRETEEGHASRREREIPRELMLVIRGARFVR